MTPFKAVAVVAILLAGAGSAQANGYAIDNSAGGVEVSSSGFGGFATAADFTGYNSAYSLTSSGGTAPCTDSIPPTGNCRSFFGPTAWAPAGGVQTPTTYAVTNRQPSGSGDPTYGTGSLNTYAFKVQNYTTNLTPGAGPYSYANPKLTPTTGWSYIGLQNLAVGAGNWVTVRALVNPDYAGDSFGIVYGTTGTLTSTSAPTAEDTVALSLYSNSTTGNPLDWNLVSFTFQAPSADIDINFGFELANGQKDYAYLGDVNIDYVPEPASLALLGAGLLGLGLIRRRRG